MNLIIVLVGFDKVNVFSQGEALRVNGVDVVLIWLIAIIHSNIVISMIDFTVVVVITFKAIGFNWFFFKIVRC